MNTANGNVIHTQELSKVYKGMQALHGLNPQVPKNSIFGFLGPNGAGKSTTIKMLPGLPEDGQPGGVVPPGGVAVPDFNDLNADWMGYYGDARQMLQSLEPGVYIPNLNQLDALIGSLTITTSN